MGKMREYNIVRVICKETVVACLHWAIAVPFPEMEKKQNEISTSSTSYTRFFLCFECVVLTTILCNWLKLIPIFLNCYSSG